MLLNYTTKIDADKTAQEIAKCLSRHGAKAVLTEYDEKEGLVTAISFKINLNGQELTFRLPCDYKPVKDWVEAQMALVETKMVTATQVFLPYVGMKDGMTLSEKIAQFPEFLLGSGNQDN